MGHITEADKLNEPINFSGTQFTTPATGDNLARIAGAGFPMQDTINRAREDKTQNAVNAFHKISYLINERGDLASIEKAKGKKARQTIEGALVMSALSDLSKAFGKTRTDRGFGIGQSSKGTPMLTFGGRF